ncbi:MAG: enoyl-CoA hydratase/isomerase family protein [Salinivirgaceae bacterium]|jgi:enoyl-CoA hydratase|nr:enoyl-CoA hydratase/isomerase family protein [Salinivirgaceae bacterium]
MDHYQQIEIEIRGNGCVLWLNNPAKRNAMSSVLIEELMHFFSQEKLPYTFVMLAGKGECFAAGADLAEISTVSQSEAIIISENLQSLFEQMEYCKIPIIAAVHGYAVGGGLELALGTDLIFSTSGAWFQLPEVNFSLIPGGGATQRLTEIIGRRSAFFYMLTAEKISAAQALQMGIIQKIFSVDDFVNQVVAYLSGLTDKTNPATVSLLKRAIRSYGTSEGFIAESRGFAQLLVGEAQKKIRKFLGKESS